MKKIGIFTLNGNPNFGNKLQNYAMQKILKDFNFDSETIINTTHLPREKRTNKELFLQGNLDYKIKMIKNKFNYERYKNLNEKRKASFNQFTKKYIKEMKFSIGLGDIPDNFHEEYEFFIAGSDQVWNPHIPAVSELSFLTFAPKEKRLTYAPSFGVSNIPLNYQKEYKKWLMGIENLSVREQQGADIIYNLTGKQAKVHVDPTMLLTKEEWLNISKIAKEKPSEKYILTYFLGDIDKEIKIKLKGIAKKNQLKIVNLASEKDKKYYMTDPSEFLDYINDAQLFITDSFHGCVFAVLLETPFVVCDRKGHSKEENMSSRIDTLVNKFGLQSRKFNNVIDREIFRCDYDAAKRILELEREISMEYFRDILKVDSN